MTRAEFDRMSVDQVETMLRIKGASDVIVEAAMVAMLEDEEDAVLAYINGNKEALNYRLDN